MTPEQVLWTLALVDHESAGTWSETIKGDQGCSTGIAQWNACAGRTAPKTYEEQVDLIGSEMLAKYQVWDLRTSVGKHNAPSWDTNPKYTSRIEAATKTFYESN